MTPEWAFVVLTLLTLAAAFWGIKRYQTPMNPLTVFAIAEMGIGQLFSGLVVYYIVRRLEPWTATKYPDTFITMTALLAALFAVGCTIPYLFKQRILVTYYGRLLRLLGLDSERTGTHFDRSKFIVLHLGALLCFIGLAVVGGGGIEWVLHPRGAYGTGRLGANPFYAATQWLLMFALIYYLWSRRPRGLRLCMVVVVYTILTSFLASKGYMMINVFIAAAYYHFRIRPIPTWIQVTMAPVGVLVSLILIVAQGTITDFAESIIYFQDYFDSTAWFLSRFHEFGFRYGGVALSYLWFFVPRGLYPDKPFYWGYLYVNQLLFPQLLATGVTPANLPWTTFYMDFGAPGVFVGGILTSIPRQVVYEYYLRNRTKMFPFIIAMHIGLISLFTLAPLPIMMVMVFVQSLFLRIVFRGRGSAPTATPAPMPS